MTLTLPKEELSSNRSRVYLAKKQLVLSFARDNFTYISTRTSILPPNHSHSLTLTQRPNQNLNPQKMCHAITRTCRLCHHIIRLDYYPCIVPIRPPATYCMAKRDIPKLVGWVRTCDGCKRKKKKEMGWFGWGRGWFGGCLGGLK